MVMHYFGGGIGHLKNTPPQQVPGFDPIDPSSDEMAVEDDDDDDDDDDDPCSGTNEDLGTVVQQPSRDVLMNGRGKPVQLEVGEDDEDDKDDEENDEDSDDDDSERGDQTYEDEEEEREDDYGYASA
jgi:hypothetical protein